MKKMAGLLGIILGGLCLSLEIYLLRLLQGLDKAAGSWYTDAWTYAGEGPCLAALILTAIIIIFSAILFITGKSEETVSGTKTEER